MKRKLFLLSLAFVLCFSVSSVQAITTIDLVPEFASVILGDPINIDVVLNTDYPNGISGGGLSFTYSDPFVNYIGSTDVDAATDVPGVDDTTGNITNWVFGTPFTLPPTPPFSGGPFTLATLAFDSTAVGTALFDLSLVFDPGGFGPVWFDGLGAEITDFSTFAPAGTSVAINAVPIPGALFLLGSGLIGLVGLRKKLS
jgi:hypothetical protein